MNKTIRQGDVLLKEIKEVPKELEERSDKTLALGEATGHHHTFNGKVKVFGSREKNNQCVLVEQDSILEHQEHKNILVEKGVYEVVIQREQDLLGSVRQVMD